MSKLWLSVSEIGIVFLSFNSVSQFILPDVLGGICPLLNYPDSLPDAFDDEDNLQNPPPFPSISPLWTQFLSSCRCGDLGRLPHREFFATERVLRVDSRLPGKNMDSYCESC